MAVQMSADDFDDAIDDATHAAYAPFSDRLAHLTLDENSALLVQINDALTAILHDYIESV